ncbi:helix-turn-helix domain-containing protein [Candidatus Saccharibacteria bacterium]|nr:helix-turn-helix domain-containing protein [Candidatus Saccharibacteria bacterium]
MDERTLKMKEAYMGLRAQGMGPREIAKQFGLSYSTVSRRLGEIAEENGVSREELLIEPWKAHDGPRTKVFEPVSKVDTEMFTRHVNAAKATINRLNDDVARNVAARTENLKKFEEERGTWK